MQLYQYHVRPERTPEYPDALRRADRALALMLERMTLSPNRVAPAPDTFTGREVTAIAQQFHYWLTLDHPGVLAALEALGEFEPMTVEDYIAIHSVKLEVVHTKPSEDWQFEDDVIIRQRVCEHCGALAEECWEFRDGGWEPGCILSEAS
jgi:hypothetical protein